MSEIAKDKNNRRLNHVKWTRNENLFRKYRYCESSGLDELDIPFSIAGYLKLKTSVFGNFIKTFNYEQYQDKYINEMKLSIMNFNRKFYTRSEKKQFEIDNNLFDDTLELLTRAVETETEIDLDFLFKNVSLLRITDTLLTHLDGDLRHFSSLKVALFCGNFLTEIEGSYLPRGLKYLELFGNCITTLKKIVKHFPDGLVHIGIQRNCLSDESSLHLLDNSRKFKWLRSLDLSENDICSLTIVLEPLKSMQSLLSLQLQGNPCYVSPYYKDDVLQALPNLLFIDNTEVLQEDRNLYLFSSGCASAVTFTCHHIMGLPSPPKQKGKIACQFYFEVNMPLLAEELPRSSETTDILPEEPTENRHNNEDEMKRSESPKRKTKETREKPKSPYAASNECNLERTSNISFKTERFYWSNIIQLPEEALLIQSCDGNLSDIRDTFRSSVNVKLIYIEIDSEHKEKSKSKLEKKGKERKDLKNSSSSYDKILDNKHTSEKIIKKVTLASFWCNLHSINWSDKTIDFHWSNRPECGPNAIEVEGSLRKIQYVFGKNKNKKSEDELSFESFKQNCPNILTIHVGFGLKRCYF